MKEYYNHWLPKLLNVAAITIVTHIYYSIPKNAISDRLRKHEQEHVKQYKRDGVIKFLAKYLCEYLRGRMAGLSHNEAYLNISYEIEARKTENNKESDKYGNTL